MKKKAFKAALPHTLPICVGFLFLGMYAFLLALMVNARHLFYGISMLEKYKNTGIKKAFFKHSLKLVIHQI